MALLYGVHDVEGAHIVPDGGWCLDTISLSEGQRRGAYSTRINWLVRLNWGYGNTGTIPERNKIHLYVNAAFDYIANTQGCTRFIVGNEPNHENERPGGQYITPSHYAECYRLLRNKVRERFGDSIKLLLAAPAPYHAVPYPWTHWYRTVLGELGSEIDGFTCHAYSRTQDAEGIHSVERSGEPLKGLWWSFFTYRDFISLIPRNLTHLEVHITEFNPIDGWLNANTGIVRAAYGEINWWNTTQEAGTPKVSSLLLYRYPGYDEGAKWGFEKKEGVLQDFREAVSMGYRSPEAQRGGLEAQKPHRVSLPSVHAPEKTVEPQKKPIRVLPIEWDERLTQRGVRIQSHPASNKWQVTRVQWLDKEQSKGLHHIFFHLEKDGKRVVGVPIEITWPSPDGQAFATTEEKPGEQYAANYPMSPSRNDFSVVVADGNPSDAVHGIGMGQDTPDGFNAAEHTSTVVFWTWVDGDTWAQEHPVKEEVEPVNIPNLFHPLNNPSARITQRFGNEDAHYHQYELKGHNGIDYGVVVGTPVYAADGGTVEEVSEQAKGYGKWILLHHEWGWSLYAHLSTQSVAVGGRVARGQFMGATGNTGDSSGPHLHFAIAPKPRTRGYPYNGYIDPAPFLKTKSQPVPAPNLFQVDIVLKNAAKEFGVDPILLGALVMAESSWVATATNPKSGAKGLGQFMPGTWADVALKIGVSDVFNPQDNARATAYHLNWCIKQTGSVRKGLWGYNFGVKRVQDGEKLPPETLEYANKILFGVDLVKAMSA